MIYLSFDTDHLGVEDLSQFLNLYPNLPRSTFFLHERTKGWNDLIHEVNPHPTILTNTSLNSTAQIGKTLSSSGVRAHSCVSSHMLDIEYAKSGFLYTSQETHWKTASIPYRKAWGIWEIPISYMDNQDMWWGKNWNDTYNSTFDCRFLEKAVKSRHAYVFDFHPLHILLNSNSPEDYYLKRDKLKGGSVHPLASDITYGVRNYFEQLLALYFEYDNRSDLSLVKLLSGDLEN